MRLSGFGRTAQAEVLAARPERISEAIEAVRALAEAEGEPATLLAHGRGRSYGDVALNHGGRVLLTERLDRLQSLDEDTGILVAEAGVTFHDLMDVFLPRGWMAPVSPGTGYASLAGALANDVHGKSHERVGSIGDHIAWIDLLLPSGELRRVRPESDPELFRATIGGLGLTGIVLQLALRLMKAPSGAVRVRERRMANLGAFLDALEACRHDATFSVGWLDGLAKGAALGRGILETAELAEGESLPHRPLRPMRVPFDLPSFALNPLTVRTFNAAFLRRVPARGRERVLPLARFLHPLDGLADWNRIYGRRGFYQFQCVLPDEAAAKGLRRLLACIADAGSASFLAVLKTLGGEGKGYLSFPMKGYTLALDFPRSEPSTALIARLEAIVLDHGGRVYLAKDALLSPAAFRAMYPEHERFKAALAGLPNGVRFRSDLARRIGIGAGP